MRPSVQAVEIPGPVLAWAPDRRRFFVVEELESTPASSGASSVDGGGEPTQLGRIWIFEPDSEAGFAGHPLPVEVSYDEAGSRAHPSRHAPRWLGDGSGIVFETRDAMTRGTTLHLYDLATEHTTVLARADDERPHSLAATVPRARSIALYRGAGNDASRRGLAWIEAPVGAKPPAAPRDRVEAGVHLLSFAPDGERMAVVLDDPETGYRLHILKRSEAPGSERGRGVPISDVGHMAWSPDGRVLAVGVLEPDRHSLPRQGHLLLRPASVGEGTSTAIAVDRHMDPDRDRALVAWHPDGRQHLRSSSDRRAALVRIFGAPTDEATDPPESPPEAAIEGSFLRRGLIRLALRLVERTVTRELESLDGIGDGQAPGPTAVELVRDDGGEARLLEMAPTDAIAWLGCSPDGRWAGVRVVRDTGRCEILAVPLEPEDDSPAEARLLGEADPDGPEASWIGDGATLAWSSHAGEARELLWCSLDGPEDDSIGRPAPR